MKILLTGGTGFIGRNIVEKFNVKYSVFSPSRIELDLLDENALKEYIISNKISVIIHSANTNHVTHPKDADSMLDFNLRMFFNICRCSDLVNKIIYFGSGAEYDARYYEPKMKEIYLGKHIPVDPYGFSKYIMAYSAENSDNIYELCLFGVYGKYEEWRRRFISNVIYQCMNCSEISINHNQIFDYLYIEDLISVVEWFLQNEPRFHRYNVCSSQPVELMDIANYIRHMLNKNIVISKKEDIDANYYLGDNSRLLAELKGFELTEWKTGVRKMIEYYGVEGFS